MGAPGYTYNAVLITCLSLSPKFLDLFPTLLAGPGEPFGILSVGVMSLFEEGRFVAHILSHCMSKY